MHRSHPNSQHRAAAPGAAALKIVKVSGMNSAPPPPLGPGRDQDVDRWGERCAGRPGREHGKADGEQVAAAEPVTQGGTVYALVVHSRPATPASRSVRMTGKAVTTTSRSSVNMNHANDVMASVAAKRLRSGIEAPRFRQRAGAPTRGSWCRATAKTQQ